MPTAYIGLGSNLGDRAEYIRAALERFGRAPGVRMRRTATVIESEAVGPAGQGPYLNTVCALETDLAPEDLLALCRAIEADLGRDRSAEAVRWGPRVIDLDLLLYGEETIAAPGLEVPHPRLGERRFALAPLAEIAPDARHPRAGCTVRELLARLEKEEEDDHASHQHRG